MADKKNGEPAARSEPARKDAAPKVDTSSPAAKAEDLREQREDAQEHAAEQARLKQAATLASRPASGVQHDDKGLIEGFVKLGEGATGILVGGSDGKATLLRPEDAARYALQPAGHLPAESGTSSTGPLSPKIEGEPCQEWNLDPGEAGVFWICHHTRFGWVVADVIKGEDE